VFVFDNVAVTAPFADVKSLVDEVLGGTGDVDGSA
jgi:hypothetical protein